MIKKNQIILEMFNFLSAIQLNQKGLKNDLSNNEYWSNAGAFHFCIYRPRGPCNNHGTYHWFNLFKDCTRLSGFQTYRFWGCICDIYHLRVIRLDPLPGVFVMWRSNRIPARYRVFNRNCGIYLGDFYRIYPHVLYCINYCECNIRSYGDNTCTRRVILIEILPSFASLK